MRKSFALICALSMTCLTGLVHASHLKGGSLTWKRDTGASGFVVDAEVIINFDLSADEYLLFPVDPDTDEIRKVNGRPFYQPGDIVGSSVTLDWGDNNGGVFIDRFEVVSVDPAAQIVTAKAIETEDVDLSHPYTWSGATHYDMQVSANARDTEEELVNRTNTDMLIGSRVTNAAGNTPPSFDPEQSNLVIVNKGTAGSPVVTFNVPVATDPDAGDTVKYSFIEVESQASELTYDENDTAWENLASTKMSITDAGVISWDTSEIDQTIQTYCIQVVAKDYAPGSSVAKSSTTLEFQVWVDDTTQTGVPEIVVSPATPVIYVHPGEKAEFQIIGYDHGENSRLELIHDADELPDGAVLLPTAGFAGGGHHNESEHVPCYFSWTPTVANLGEEYEMHFKFEDEDGFQSDEVTATVVVVSAPTTPLEPLLMAVSEVNYSPSPQGMLVSFTVVGTCASTNVPISLYTDQPLPDGASFTPVLPVQGTSSVTSTFTWQMEPGEYTHAGEPTVINVLLGDAYRRVTSRTVNVVVGPPPPVVTLAAGTTVPVPATAWEELIVSFNATGGSGHHTELTFAAENAGTVEEAEMDSPAANRVMWKVVPGQIPGGVLRVRVTDEWGGSSVLSVPVSLANPGAPTWWDSTNPSEDVLTGGAAVDFGMANQGQLKAIASRAYAKLESEFPTIATETAEGIALAAYVSGFQASSGNYEPLLQGQLKHAGSLFYKAIGAVTGKGDIGFPWAKDGSNDLNHSPATVGQVKMVFSFPLPLRGVIFNEPPSSVVITSPVAGTLLGEQDITVQVSATDVDGNIDQVEFYEDGVLFAIDRDAPYEAVFEDALVGSYLFTAKAVDLKGLERTSDPVAVDVESSAPSAVAVSIVTPPVVNGEYPTGMNVQLQVTASDPDNNLDHVDVYEGETLIQSIYFPYSTPYPFVVWWHQNNAGPYELWAKAIDADGQELSSTRLPVVRYYNAPPFMSMYAPTQNQRFPIYPTSATVSLEAGASDTNGVDRIEYWVGMPGYTYTHVGNSVPPFYSVTWNPTIAGNYVIEARAFDIYGARTVLQRNVTIVATTTVTMQEGMNGYAGTVADTRISSNSTTNAANGTLGVRYTTPVNGNNPTIASLVKWDMSQIPTTATVLAASMTVNLETAGTGPSTVHLMKTAWTETGATWALKSAGTSWGAAGATGTADVESTSLGAIYTNSTVGPKTLNFTTTPTNTLSKIQGWVTSPATNHGVKIKIATGSYSVEGVISSSETQDLLVTQQYDEKQNRPKLVVTYWE